MTTLCRPLHRFILTTAFLLFECYGMGSSFTSTVEGGKLIITKVEVDSAFIVPLSDTVLVKNGARAKEVEIAHVMAISSDGQRLFALSEGSSDDGFQILTLDLRNNSSPSVVDSELIFYDEDNGNFSPRGLLWIDGEFIVVHNNNKFSMFDDLGEKQSTFEDNNLSFGRDGDGLKSLTLDPAGQVFWSASFVGQPEDGSRNIRLLQYDVNTGKSDGLHQFAYILESDPAEGIMSNNALSSNAIESSRQVPLVDVQSSTKTAQSTNSNPDSVNEKSSSQVPKKWVPFSRNQSNVSFSTSVSEQPRQGCGLLSLVALDSFGNFLALERVLPTKFQGESNATFQIQLFYVETADAGDVTNMALMNVPSLKQIAANKTLLLNLADIDHGRDWTPDFESMSLLAAKDNNTITIIFVSNNQYQSGNDTYVMSLDLKYETQKNVPLRMETYGLAIPTTRESGSSNRKLCSAKVWIHPKDPAESLVLATNGNGLTVFNLNGETIFKSQQPMVMTQSSESNSSNTIGNVWYSSLDIIYAFPLGSDRLVDLVVLGDSSRKALEFRLINPFALDRGTLENMTGWSKNHTLGSVDAADFVAAYTSPYTGSYYVFVGDIEGHGILQLKIFANEVGRVDTEIVRRISLPDGELAAMEIDMVTGTLYVSINSLNGGGGIYKYDAEPDPQNSNGFLSVVVSSEEDEMMSSFIDLSIYYAGDREGYLIASKPTDTSLTLFNRDGKNEYVGSFALGGLETNETIRSGEISVMNVNLGSAYSCGMAIVQDAVTSNRNDNPYSSATGFQLLKWDEIAVQGDPQAFDVETHSWHPRRLALVILVDKIAEEVFVEMALGRLSPRVTQDLMELLAVAAFELYRPGSAMRQMMNHAVGTTSGDIIRRSMSEQHTGESFNAHLEKPSSRAGNNLRGIQRNLQEHNNVFFASNIQPRCSLDEFEDDQGSYAQVGAQLKEFAWKVSDLIGLNTPTDNVQTEELPLSKEVGESWINRIEAIIWALPQDMRLGA